VSEKVFEQMVEILSKYEGTKMSERMKNPVGRPSKENKDV
jgi:predicted Zn-dependent protease with MMP-like domain